MCCIDGNSALASDSPEDHGRFFGMSENFGHVMDFKMIADNTHTTTHRSNARPTYKPLASNLHLDPLTMPNVVKS